MILKVGRYYKQIAPSMVHGSIVIYYKVLRMQKGQYRPKKVWVIVKHEIRTWKSKRLVPRNVSASVDLYEVSKLLGLLKVGQ